MARPPEAAGESLLPAPSIPVWDLPSGPHFQPQSNQGDIWLGKKVAPGQIKVLISSSLHPVCVSLPSGCALGDPASPET